MPANSLPDPSLMFLYLCLINSDYKKIDFAAVGEATGLKVPAARMRWSRLKKTIESGMVDGKVNLKPAEGGADEGDSTEDEDASAAAPASLSPQKKRRVTKAKAKSPAAKKGKAKESTEEGEEDGDMVKEEDTSDAVA
ncbi:uncharacterized protein BJX67DRAFT_385355 [Aspergillus lucknowensis]|uniref:Myb-like DNA-binding domain-containing protein n=1 Tax=Aspergillus lucknowensis TaxID=176173 RepID=A0ABR4LE89_9EURO